MPEYAFMAMTQHGASEVDELTGLEGRRVDVLLNRPGGVTASLPVSHPTARRELLTPGNTELKVYREGVPIETAFVCTQANPKTQPVPRLDLGWQGISSLLDDALVYGQTSAFSSTTLPWTWINTYQTRTSGSRSFTAGTTTGTATSQSRTIETDDTITNAINSLAERQNGFDWRLSPSRGLDLWYPQRGSDRGLELVWGENVLSFNFAEPAGPGVLASDARVRGGISNAMQTASRAATRTVYGRREVSIVAAGEIDVSGAYLAQIAARTVAERAAPPIIPNVVLDSSHSSVAWGEWWLGDTVTFYAKIGEYMTIAEEYRIVGIHIVLDAENNERISLDLNLVDV